MNVRLIRQKLENAKHGAKVGICIGAVAAIPLTIAAFIIDEGKHEAEKLHEFADQNGCTYNEAEILTQPNAYIRATLTCPPEIQNQTSSFYKAASSYGWDIGLSDLRIVVPVIFGVSALIGGVIGFFHGYRKNIDAAKMIVEPAQIDAQAIQLEEGNADSMNASLLSADSLRSVPAGERSAPMLR